MRRYATAKMTACFVACACLAALTVTPAASANDGSPFDDWGCPWSYVYLTGNGDEESCYLTYEGGTYSDDPDYIYGFITTREHFANERDYFNLNVAAARSQHDGTLYHRDLFTARGMAYLRACVEAGAGGVPECTNSNPYNGINHSAFATDALRFAFDFRLASASCPDDFEPWHCGWLPVPSYLFEDDVEPEPEPEPGPGPQPGPPGGGQTPDPDEEYEEIDPNGEEYADCIDTAPDVKETYEMKVDWKRGEFVCELDLREATQCRTKNAEKVVYRPHGSYINGVYHYTINAYCKYPGGKGKANAQSSSKGKGKGKSAKAKTCKQRAKAKGFKRASRQTAFIKKCNAKKVKSAKAKAKAKKRQAVKGVQVAGGVATPSRLAVSDCVPGREIVFQGDTIATFQSLSAERRASLCSFVTNWVRTDPYFLSCTHEPWWLVVLRLTVNTGGQDLVGGCESDFGSRPLSRDNPNNKQWEAPISAKRWQGWELEGEWFYPPRKWNACTKAHGQRACGKRVKRLGRRADKCVTPHTKVKAGGRKAFAKAARRCGKAQGLRIRYLTVY